MTGALNRRGINCVCFGTKVLVAVIIAFHKCGEECLLPRAPFLAVGELTNFLASRRNYKEPWGSNEARRGPNRFEENATISDLRHWATNDPEETPLSVNIRRARLIGQMRSNGYWNGHRKLGLVSVGKTRTFLKRLGFEREFRM